MNEVGTKSNSKHRYGTLRSYCNTCVLDRQAPGALTLGKKNDGSKHSYGARPSECFRCAMLREASDLLTKGRREESPNTNMESIPLTRSVL